MYNAALRLKSLLFPLSALILSFPSFLRFTDKEDGIEARQVCSANKPGDECGRITVASTLTEAKQASFMLSEIWDTLVLQGSGGRYKQTGV